MMIDRVGSQLHTRHGKKKSYTQAEITAAAREAGYSIDVHCWAYCVFMDESSFRAYHESIGEVCNYDATRATMLESLGPSLGFSLPHISMPDFLNFEMPSLIGQS